MAGWFRSKVSGTGKGYRDVRIDQGVACDCGHLVDGRHAVSAAAVRLPLRRRDRLKTVRDVQGDGTPAAEGDHQSGHDHHLAGRVLPRLERALVRLRLAAWQAFAGADPVR